MPPELCTAIAAATDALERKDRASDAVVEARERLSAARLAKEKASSRLESAEEALAMAEERTSPLMAASKEAHAALEQADRDISIEERALAARERMLPEFDAAISKATDAALEAAKEWKVLLLREHVRDVLAEGARRIASAFAAFYAIDGSILGRSANYEAAFRETVLPDAGSFGGRYLFREGHYSGEAGVSVNFAREGWRFDADAVRLYDELATFREIKSRLTAARAAIPREREGAVIEGAVSVRSVPQDRFEEPGENDLRDKFLRIMSENGRLPLETTDFESFSAAYRRIGNLRKTSDLDKRRDLDFWCEEFGVWARSVGVFVRRMPPAVYVAAALAHGIRMEIRDPIRNTLLALEGAIWSRGGDAFGPNAFTVHR